MKIATYNVWNSEAGLPNRHIYVVDEIKRIDADIVCLQEVRNRSLAERISNNSGYQYWYFDNYPKCDEGLCILSHTPFEECDSFVDASNAIYCSFLCEGKRISVVNVHLPWDSVSKREEQIIHIVSAINRKHYDYVYLAGDFNCSDRSDVQRFLTGECLLNDCESNPCWFDLALSYAELSGTAAECTLNFRENPRFKQNTIETNSRFDRILLRNPYPLDFPVLSKCSVFGKTVFSDIDLAASDHYGLVVEID